MLDRDELAPPEDVCDATGVEDIEGDAVDVEEGAMVRVPLAAALALCDDDADMDTLAVSEGKAEGEVIADALPHEEDESDSLGGAESEALPLPDDWGDADTLNVSSVVPGNDMIAVRVLMIVPLEVNETLCVIDARTETDARTDGVRETLVESDKDAEAEDEVVDKSDAL